MTTMSVSNDESFNTSVINTSSFRDGDLEMFLDCLEELCKKNDEPVKVKKSNRPRTRGSRTKNRLNKTTSFNSVEKFLPPHFSSCADFQATNDQSVINDTFSSINTTNFSCPDADANASCISEQFNDIFAYFNEDIVTDKTLFDDDYEHDTPEACEKENIANNLLKLSIHPKRIDREANELQSKSKSILNSIKLNNDLVAQEAFQKNKVKDLEKQILFGSQNPSGKLTSNVRLNKTVCEPLQSRPHSYSSASTLSLHDSDSSDFVFKKPTNIDISTKNVKEKISFFNETIATERHNSVSPSIPSTPEDEDYQFQRQRSKRTFQQNRDFFEKMFKERFERESEQKSIQNLNLTVAKDLPKNPNNNNNNVAKAVANNKYNEKLYAVQTYVQTQYLLERIQKLLKAISNLEEQQLSKMNLKSLKKFLIFIRDCSYKCQEVCNNISEHFLTDFEKNVMSAEELLYSALKEADLNEVPYLVLLKFDTNLFVFTLCKLIVLIIYNI